MTEVQADRMVEAARAGEAWAQGLKVGDVFLGCGPEATARGYERDTPEYRLFIWSAMCVLDKVVLISTDQGKIVRLEVRS